MIYGCYKTMGNINNEHHHTCTRFFKWMYKLHVIMKQIEKKRKKNRMKVSTTCIASWDVTLTFSHCIAII